MTIAHTCVSQMAFILDDVDGASELAAGMPAHVAPVVLDHGFDGLTQIASTLHGRSALDAIHLFCHAGPRELRLGSVHLGGDDLPRYLGDLSEIARALAGRGNLMIYPCGDERARLDGGFLESLRRILGAGVAAVLPSSHCSSACGSWCLGALQRRGAPQPLAFS